MKVAACIRALGRIANSIGLVSYAALVCYKEGSGELLGAQCAPVIQASRSIRRTVSQSLGGVNHCLITL